MRLESLICGGAEVIARWPVPDAQVALIVFNTDIGKVAAAPPCVAVNSDVWFDAVPKRTTLPEAKQRMCLRSTTRIITNTAEVPTANRAKSSVLVPELDRLYIAVFSKGKTEATVTLQIYEVQR